MLNVDGITYCRGSGRRAVIVIRAANIGGAGKEAFLIDPTAATVSTAGAPGNAALAETRACHCSKVSAGERRLGVSIAQDAIDIQAKTDEDFLGDRALHDELGCNGWLQ